MRGFQPLQRYEHFNVSRYCTVPVLMNIATLTVTSGKKLLPRARDYSSTVFVNMMYVHYSLIFCVLLHAT